MRINLEIPLSPQKCKKKTNAINFFPETLKMFVIKNLGMVGDYQMIIIVHKKMMSRLKVCFTNI